MKRRLILPAAMCLLVVTAACGTKSPAGGSNSLTAPTPVTPAMGASVSWGSQPITMTVKNAVTTGSGELTYTFEVSTDSAFTASAVVVKKEKVAAGSGGQTSVKLDSSLAGGKGYYWRARANDGSVDGPNSSAVNFSIGAAVDLQAPQPESPESGSTVGVRPNFVIQNCARSGPAGPISYRFEVADNTSFNPVAATASVQEQSGGKTTWTPDSDLTAGKTYYWRVRSTDPGNNVSSGFTNTRSINVTKTGDEIDPTQITWLSPSTTDITHWKVTSTVTDTYVDPRTICVYHTMSGQWPLADIFHDGNGANIEGNMLLVAKINGKWYGGGIDWLGQGRTCKGLPAVEIGMDQVRVSPMDASWPGPKAGDQVGLLVSTPASERLQGRTVNERSNIKLIIWPY